MTHVTPDASTSSAAPTERSETSRTLRRLACAVLVLVAVAAIAFLVPYAMHLRATRLHRASANGDLAAVQRLLASGVDLDRPRSLGFLFPIYHFTPLQYAALDGHEPVMSALLAAGADIEARNPWDMTALLLAVWMDVPRSAQVLLEAGADPNTSKRGCFTPLTVACESADLELVRLLLRYGADPNFSAPGCESVMDWAVRTNAIELLAVLREPRAAPGAPPDNPPPPRAPP